MYSPTSRLLTVLELLQSNTEITASELARRLEVDARSIRRYILMLQDMGIPVEATRGRYGAYHLARGFKLPPLMFTDAEVTALTLGVIVIRELQFPVDLASVSGALAKLERVMPENLLARTHGLQRSILVDLFLPRLPFDHRLLVQLSDAALQQRRVMLTYRSWQNEVTERRFDVYGIVYHEGYWYAVGQCHLRHSLRTFRIDRIIGIDNDGAAFERPVELDARQVVIDALSSTPGHGSIEILLETTLAEAQQAIPPEVGTLEAVEGGVILRRAAQNLEWVARMLIALPFPIQIRQPTELRQVMHELVHRAIEQLDTIH